jgi:hypothetical protein
VIVRAARFVVDFVVGDDLVVAAGVAVALVLTALAAQLGGDAWLLLVVAVPLVLGLSLWRGVRDSFGPGGRGSRDSERVPGSLTGA